MIQHVGIIPDGNRRWAKAKGLPALEGHEAGFKALQTLLEECREDGPRILSFYAFSTENFARSEAEVQGLFGLLDRVLKAFTQELIQHKIRLVITGSRQGLSSALLKKLDKAVQACAAATDGQFTLNICLNYGGQQELSDAAQKLARQCLLQEILPEDITPSLMEKEILGGLPPVDLLIRTSGEQRISNFMLWQCAYAEFTFPSALWPDFTPELFRQALTEFENRHRRFGA